ncbi:lasso peptide isopeptide bond-forming cyclase [Acaryochloris sp. CCMEE 5410]|uniref:lasso peptide isopeptide bond-forming cyclase n=1 Tax=Acaryochloris sp. CCMEE 5410 TaxID=310037 RepID=UPI0004944FF8|nr:lasso peptide isopeptide bond-forming cyclase [Acaryochloris sp. CCMEE 5410]KAI9131596.1 lasso peptide isopeptide bond-forming cyclase [Acaryochloris sp. CCMEE 5410]
MSAITGFVYPHPLPERRDYLHQMVQSLSHRGPDGTNEWSQDRVGLGHCLLQTTPESRFETLPLSNTSQTLVLTADARIDNRADLMIQLGLEESPSAVITDSALILAAYEKWGEQCPEYLLGDFAFALWDATQQHLFCARDHFGVKPFFYYASEQVFAFASEMKALFHLPEVPKALNETRVADYLTLMLFDAETTFYEQIVRLPPAHRMTVSQNSLNISAYWSLDPDFELQLDSDQAYAEQFQSIFTEAVRCRLRSAFPIGTMLSGGIDSSSITCMTAQLRQEAQETTKFPTFSAVFNEITASDEQEFMNAVIHQRPIEPQYVQGDQLSPWTDYQHMLALQDEPLFACNAHLTHALYQIAQSQSVRVLLDGFDGDQAVSHGVGYLRTLAKAGRWFKLWREMKGFCQSFGYDLWPLYRSYVRKFGINPLLKKTKITKILGKVKTWQSRGQQNTSEASPARPWAIPLTPDFVDRASVLQRYKHLRRQRFGAQPSQRHEHIVDVTSGLVSATLEVMDRTAAASQVELRFPFWDKRLVEFCVSLPEEQKMQNGWTRLIIRRGLDGILPPQIQWRAGKGNLGTAFDHTLEKYGIDLIHQVLSHPPDAIEMFLDMQELSQLVQRWQRGEAEANDTLLIWIAVNLTLWLQQANLRDNPLEFLS